ncbi:MAG TPA: radical SAM protein [Syntrophorhabdaceae bacterium]|nr:radical SAM protein [Syntrophorhabdaceae bacterium]HQM81488.1 radical SAM protein [Syntrophorhabdaceae bacterium]
MSRYVFGPVPSRRLGNSLGVDIIPGKYCCFDCIYCQIGKTTNHQIERKSFFDPYAIVSEVIEEANKSNQIDYITFSGSGEPTLNSDLGLMIDEVKRAISVPVSVITSGALLFQDDVRRDLLSTDIILPSLDAVSEDIFRYINRPHLVVDAQSIISGLKLFRKDFRGKIWLEVMLVKDINDDEEELGKIKEVVESVGVDKIQLNTVTRPPSEDIPGMLTREELERARSFLGDICEIISKFEETPVLHGEKEWSKNVLNILKRRSLSLDEIVKVTGVSFYKAKNRLKLMENEEQIKSYHFHDTIFYMFNR